MAYIFVDRDNDMGGMRENMRRTMMRSGGNVMMRGTGMENHESAYRMGYRHGWEDSEDEMMKDDGERFRRMRDSRGRFI